MVRYANAAAFYLGHHWAFRKMPGEPQLTFNYVQALSDFLTNFSLGKPISYQVEREYQHIIPALLDRIWDKDNNKLKLQWEIGQMGSIFGDIFVKVAYEEPYVDGAGMPHAGKVKIIPLNPATCFPRWHPHDRSRMIEFKQKYRFWSDEPDGTRLVNTYVEIITDTSIKEYRNNELVRDTPNPLGCIPVVHIANQIAPGSPWGLSDIWNVISINREFNEKSTDISDIINYYAAPVTIVTGAKPANLLRGPNKMWGSVNDKVKVYNLEGGFQGLPPALEYLEKLKQRMHEMAGVPVTALGEEQAISNTSGVALAIQYMPTMQKHNVKQITYGVGLRDINRLALMTLFMKEPDQSLYDPNTKGIMEDGQAPAVNPADPDVYEVSIDWPAPLPTDMVIKIDEIQRKMELGLESRRGALKELGAEFPDEKLEELFEEQLQDMYQEGSKALVRAAVTAIIAEATGIVPEEGGEPVEPQEQDQTNADGTKKPAPQKPAPTLPVSDIAKQMMAGFDRNLWQDIVVRAFSPRVPMKRNVDVDSNKFGTQN